VITGLVVRRQFAPRDLGSSRREAGGTVVSAAHGRSSWNAYRSILDAEDSMRTATGRKFAAIAAALVGLAAAAAPAAGAPAAGGAAPVPTAYVTNNRGRTVSVVHGQRLVAAIPVGNGPAGIAITPDGRKAYVADFGYFNQPAYTVTPILLRTNTPQRPIRVGRGPLAVAITPDGAHAVVTLQGSASKPGHQAVVIDLATRTVSAPVEVGAAPESVAITPDGTTAYVAAFGAGQITPIDLTVSPPQPRAPIPLPGTAPRAIAITPNGRTAYVLDASNATIIPIRLATRHVGTAVGLVCQQQGDPGCTPSAIAITPDGHTAYVAAAGSSDVMQLALPSLTVIRVIPTDGYPDGVAFASGRVYVACAGSDTVNVVKTRAGTVGTVAGFVYPFGVAVAPAA
jgi:YVTN family beta-propeller protein